MSSLGWVTEESLCLIYSFTWKFLLMLHVHLVFKAILAIDAVAPIWAEEALVSCIGALTS